MRATNKKQNIIKQNKIRPVYSPRKKSATKNKAQRQKNRARKKAY